ncbi:conserved hypothetical protein [Talaromyces stipitatus ATCC 10500]|uniref:Mis18 domain-containing protein n=1 Tax=Talaromyces stipitatus (strain ATCC 10500 / CBS 375.48 / QM 6759 / NRRL 1006) TaxID=441959 RepID=B8LXV8_TALSN|nr:uncharacterized protein TSTA_062600 [Talaromyces stipitatus ATCC 10500]EED22773.1 conserved hypothetical protein [Talaromyces stipitatus ATCC 10500]
MANFAGSCYRPPSVNMILSHLSRPSILCQCSRCSSSVAACENEWAKLSDTYSTVTGWLSIDRNRINVSSEKKQIPQSSELGFVRGRVVQDIVCRLCHQKLGGLVHLESDTKVFWKLSKMSFREIISMRESHPLFVEGSLSWLLAPVEQTPAPNESANNTPLSATHSEARLSQTLYNQGASLSRISNTVEELHDTMADLKQSFKALRLELNTTPSARNPEYHGDEAMQMLRTVLKELQSKSDEIEKLKLENESLKLKARYLQGRPLSAVPTTPRMLEDAAMPEEQSPGFLNESGKRGLLGASTQLQIADSFEDHEPAMEHTTTPEVAQHTTAPVKVPLKPAADILSGPKQLTQQEQDLAVPTGFRRRRESGEPATKRPRISSTEDPESSDTNVDVESHVPRKRRGRPSESRRSLQAASHPRTPSTLSISDPSTINQPNTEIQTADERVTDRPDNSENTQPARKPGNRRSRKVTSRSNSQAASRARSASPRVTRNSAKLVEENGGKQAEKPTLGNEPPGRRGGGFEILVNVAELTPESVVNENDLFNRLGHPQEEDGSAGNVGEKTTDDSEQRQARVAAREMIVKAAMEREEAMADG